MGRMGRGNENMNHERDNIYRQMPLERVIEDARAGVSLARRALAVRDPEAAWRLGIGIEASKQTRTA